MNDDVGAVVDRAEQDRRRHGVIDHEWNAVPRRDLGQRFNVADVSGRIADAFAEDRAGFFIDQPLDRFSLIGLGKADVDALPRQHVREQRMRRAVKLRDRDDVAADLSEIEHGVVQRRLSRADAQSLEAAFEFGYAAFEYRGGRITDAAVAVPGHFKIEQGSAVIGTFKFVSYSLIDGDRDGPGRRLGVVTAVNSNRIAFHNFPPRRVFQPAPTLSSFNFLCVADEGNNLTALDRK